VLHGFLSPHCQSKYFSMSQEASSDNHELSDSSPFHVTGIAFVVEERGKGARLVLRYPVTEEGLPSEDTKDSNLFFTLPPRVMAKLFRPKKPLCGQPMTISVGGNVFCCRAVLLEEKDLPDGDEAESSLVLFSVVVALTPSIQTSAIPSGWFDSDQRPSESPKAGKLPAPAKPALAHASKSFLAIKRVHVSLVRLCRVLEREERRCRYISIQAAHMLQITDDFHSNKEKQEQAISATSSGNATPADTGKSRRHRRTLTPATISATPTFTETVDTAKPIQEPVISVRDRQERDQEIFEIMLSAPSDGKNIHGNIAREMVHVYHALSRNDNDFPPTPSTLLSGRDGTVYINRHVAVPIEAGSGISFLEAMPVVRPYHTLLFPHSSANDLVASFSSSAARLQQLLIMTNPRKSLADIATDAALSLPTVMELASFLVGHEACIASHVMTKGTVLVCSDYAIPRMQQLALEFSEQFFQLSIFTVVSIFTCKGLALGEVFRSVKNGEGEESELIGSVLAAVLGHSRASSESGIPHDLDDVDVRPGDVDFLVEESGNSQMEETLFAMAVWLRAKKVLVTLQEYFMACGLGSHPPAPWAEDSLAALSTTSHELDGKQGWQVDADQAEQALFRELWESNCLNGNVSTVAMCWKVGVDMRRLHRFRVWAVKTGRILTVFRAPSPGDDWGC
jgi:hypothetical protein